MFNLDNGRQVTLYGGGENGGWFPHKLNIGDKTTNFTELNFFTEWRHLLTPYQGSNNNKLTYFPK